VTKIYTSENNVTIGMQQINAEFHRGEFVAIIGESGSGKSTLLNVLSGNHSYEEGEMYIDGKETSHYSVSDWENYRRKYISYIFQDYKLVDSYTVLQNVELSLMLAITNKTQRIAKAKELIEKVGLTPHLKQKCTKLSGGQKQRVAIARALAKDCPIILADEPTGNLDSKMGKEIMNLLFEVSKDKLVIIVTHDYEDIEDFATRKIRFYDGKIAEDKIIKKVENFDALNKEEEIKKPTQKEIVKKTIKREVKHYTNSMQVGFNNVLATPKKSLFMIVIMFIAIFMVFFCEGALKYESYSNNIVDCSPNRIVAVSNQGKFTDEQIKAMEGLDSVESIVYNDVLRDKTIECCFFADGENYMYTSYQVRCIDYAPAGVLQTKTLADDECIFVSRYDDEDKKFINFSQMKLSEKKEKSYYKVVEYIKENNDLSPVIYINKNQYMMQNMVEYVKQFMSLSHNGEDKDAEIHVDFNKGLALNEMVYSTRNAFVDYSNIILSLDVFGQKYNIDLSKYSKTEEANFEGNSIALPIEIAKNIFEAMPKESASINFTNGNGSISSATKVIEKAGLSACYLPNGQKESEDSEDVVVSMLFDVLNASIFIGAFIMVLIIALRIYKSKSEDYIIMRSLGYDKRYIKYSLINENVFLSIFAMVPAVIIAVVLKCIEFKSFADIAISTFIVIPLGVVLMMVILALINVKHIFKFAINKTFSSAKGDK
ncbi:MAG: ABC transporter ATP-binding protein/permease, partial [Clostridia bacterium]